MFQVADWSRRKLEIADAFHQAAPLPAEADHELYAELLLKIGVSTNQDMNIFISFMNDIIMAARREERPATPLETFPDWLRYKRTHEIQDAKPQDIQNPGI
jgi:hypothetical protein